MTDRPILFSVPMVQALLDGRKTQTRRLLPNPEYYGCPTGDCPHARQDECNHAMRENTAADLRFAVGDRLYVREAFAYVGTTDPGWLLHRATYQEDCRRYGFDKPIPDESSVTWKPGIHMPRSVSRLTLLVTEVRVERLNDCSEADGIAEGIHQWRHYPTEGEPYQAFKAFGREPAHRDPRLAYRDLWNSINGAGAWEANPWVVAVSFIVEQRNIDT